MATGRAGDMPDDQSQPLRVFSYALAERRELYLGLIDAFAAARERFRLQLRPSELARLLSGITDEEVASALEQLAEWGNLRRLYDAAAPETLEEFYAKRFLYQLTPEGIAAHEGVAAVRRAGLDGVGRLSAVLLPGIVERLEAIRVEAADPDPARMHNAFVDLFGAFAELAENAGRYMSDLAIGTSELAADDERFLSYKRAVLAYLNEFVGRMSELVPRIAGLVEHLDPMARRLVAIAASADQAPTLDGDDTSLLRSFERRWSGVRAWFVADGDEPPVADALRQAMVDALNRILAALARLNERHLRRVTREADFTQLAPWFAAAEGDGAHELWDVAFGLWPARHLVQPCGEEEEDRARSFFDVAPVEVAPVLRAAGTRGAPGRVARRADYSDTKQERLSQLRGAQERAAAAMARLAERTPVRLSQLGELDRAEFEQFLVLLDAALSSPPDSEGVRRANTPTVRLALRPAPERRRAAVSTVAGVLHVPDYLLELQLASARGVRHDAPAGSDGGHRLAPSSEGAVG